ncbi:hypothetical protein SMD44_05476 [Streptomyces alboflavus]|uniref:Uncharacterized protein n=1 Tax=Streptomyces alboflavus TaxID=67267 RepID=A0A1Z1WHT7_9ACTN|nr:hypothetical protein SMD44_05476 [Streptomyces alboflavus]
MFDVSGDRRRKLCPSRPDLAQVSVASQTPLMPSPFLARQTPPWGYLILPESRDHDIRHDPT